MPCVPGETVTEPDDVVAVAMLLSMSTVETPEEDHESTAEPPA